MTRKPCKRHILQSIHKDPQSVCRSNIGWSLNTVTTASVVSASDVSVVLGGLKSFLYYSCVSH